MDPNATRQAPLSLGFSSQEYWSGLPFPSSGDFLTQGSDCWLSYAILWLSIADNLLRASFIHSSLNAFFSLNAKFVFLQVAYIPRGSNLSLYVHCHGPPLCKLSNKSHFAFLFGARFTDLVLFCSTPSLPFFEAYA